MTWDAASRTPLPPISQRWDPWMLTVCSRDQPAPPGQGGTAACGEAAKAPQTADFGAGEHPAERRSNDS
jgi:hypothetical protein